MIQDYCCNWFKLWFKKTNQYNLINANTKNALPRTPFTWFLQASFGLQSS